MGNLAVTGKETHLAAFPYVGGSYSGTGDLFASVLAGGLARGEKSEVHDGTCRKLYRESDYRCSERRDSAQ